MKPTPELISKTDTIKADIEFNCLKDYVRKIKSQLPKPERHLVQQWLAKLKHPHTQFRGEYISRMYTEIVRGYLCPPFSAEPPVGELEPLPPPHTHTNSECCTTLSSLASNETCFSMESKEVSLKHVMADSESAASDVKADDIVRVRSEPNLMSKFHLMSKSRHGDQMREEDTMGDVKEKLIVKTEGDVKEKLIVKTGRQGEKNVSSGLFAEALREFEEEIREAESLGMNERNEKAGKVEKVGEVKKAEEVEKVAEVRHGNKQAENEETCSKTDKEANKNVTQEVNSIKNTDIGITNAPRTVERISSTDAFIAKYCNSTIIQQLVKLNKHSREIDLEDDNEVKAESIPLDRIKEVREVFLNKKYIPNDAKDVPKVGRSNEKMHIYDQIKKIANMYQNQHQDKITELEAKIKTLTMQNNDLTALNQKDKADIEELRREVETLKRGRSNKEKVSDGNPTDGDVSSKNTADIHVTKGNEKLSDIIDTLSGLLEKSNRHIEKLSSLAIKFNLIKSDYELERKEMILKFKSIDSLHQNILTELVKQRVNESKEYEDLIHNYRKQFDEKNVQIAKLQNSACDACAKRRTNTETTKNDSNEVELLRDELSRMMQINKDLIYSYEKKMKKLMSEKYLEGKLMNTLLKAQKEEIEIYLTGQKHEELRKLAENLESQYGRIVDDAIRMAKSQQHMDVSR